MFLQNVHMSSCSWPACVRARFCFSAHWVLPFTLTILKISCLLDTRHAKYISVSSSVRFGLCGGEVGLRCGGKFNLPGVCSSVAAGWNQVDGAAHREPAANSQPDTRKQKGDFFNISPRIIQLSTQLVTNSFPFLEVLRLTQIELPLVKVMLALC